MGTSQWVLSVSFARVYFHCHWVLDCFVGIVVAFFVAFTLTKIGYKDFLKHIFLNYVGVSTAEYEEDGDL